MERDYFFYNTYGNLMWAQASYLVKQNLSASSTYFQQAIQAYDKAFTLQSDRIDAFVNAGSVPAIFSHPHVDHVFATRRFEE